MSHDHSKRVIIVTGASKGLGLAIVQLLLSFSTSSHSNKAKTVTTPSGVDILSQAIKVVAVSRSETDELKRIAKEHSEDVEIVLGDVSDDSINQKAVGVAVEKFGQLDALILNAGTLHPLGRIESTPLDGWRKCFEINFFSLVSILQHATPHLRRAAETHPGGDAAARGVGSEEEHERVGPRVVMVSSGAAVGGTAGWAVYNASKAAMNSLARTFANEEKGIATYAVRPGVVDTDMQATLRSIGAEHMQKEDMERFMTVHKEGKLLKPEDPGHVIAALSLAGPKEMSGQFVSWDADELKAFRR